MKPALQGYETVMEAVSASQTRKPVPGSRIGGCEGDVQARLREALRSLSSRASFSPVLSNKQKVVYEDFLL